MRPYLLRSLGLHLALGAALAFLSARVTAPKSNPVYSIDFVGPSGGIITSLSGRSAPAAPASPRLAPQAKPDDFGTKRRKPGAPLPRPSLLRGYQVKPKPEEKAPEQPSAGAASAGGAGGEAGVSTDLPNFPHAWYISQVRAALWGRWSERLPSEAGQAVVVFTILRTGAVVDVRTEESSGDPAFDLIALSAVQEAAPFPPLPGAFPEPFLKVHVTLKSQ